MQRHPAQQVGNAERLYEMAKRASDNGNYRDAIAYYEQLEARFPFSNPARQGQLDLMYAYYKNREPESAIDQADQFIRENPAHPRVDYAYYIKGLVQFERNPNFLERWFNADLTERPPIDARKSFQAFQTLLERFPNSEYADDSRKRMVFLRNRLASYEVYVAELLPEARRVGRRDQSLQVRDRELRRRAADQARAGDHGGVVSPARHDRSRRRYRDGPEREREPGPGRAGREEELVEDLVEPARR